MAEMDVYHEQKIEDVKMVIGDYLDSEIVLYEQACNFLLTYDYNLPNQPTNRS